MVLHPLPAALQLGPAMFFGLLDGKVRAALFALASVGLGAWIYVRAPTFALATVPSDARLIRVLVCLALGAALGLAASPLGRAALPRAPRLALALFELRACVALAMLAAITWATLCASGLLTPADTDAATVKQSLDTLEKAVTAVIAAIGAAVAGDQSRNAVAVLAEDAFQTAFKTYGPTPPAKPVPADTPVRADTEVANAAYSDPYVPEVTLNRDGSKPAGASGWGFEARWARAAAIRANLR